VAVVKYRRFDDRRFDDKPVDRQTFRRHGSDVSTTHFGRFAGRQICVNVELQK